MKLLDLFCGAGGGAWGYHLAGFEEIVGIDIVNQRHYPFEFIRGNVFDLEPGFLAQFDVIHASPPCQAYCDSKNYLARYFPDAMADAREMLKSTGKPYVIENIPEAPWEPPIIQLCGTMFDGLRVIRHRGFECNLDIPQPKHIRRKEHPLVYTSSSTKNHYGKLDPWKDYVTVTGGGGTTVDQALDAMCIPYKMFKREVNEAIPPPYTEYVGGHILRLMGKPYKNELVFVL